MPLTSAGSCLAAIMIVAVVELTEASPRQAAAATPAPAPGKATQMTLTGCVSGKPGTSGQYTFQDADGIRQYRLNGKGVNKFAGQRVELVAGAGGKGLSIRGGLWPSPNVAARGGDIDPAQEAIGRQPGGGGAPALTAVPELRVSRLRAVEGACE